MYRRNETMNRPYKGTNYGNVKDNTSMKPYYYLRNGLLHVRYAVDKCIELSTNEDLKIKAELSSRPYAKQDILAENWNFYTECVGKEVIQDGIKAAEKVMAEKTKEYNNGFKNK